MGNSPNSSCASANCRLEWRPSWLLRAWLLLSGMAGVWAVLASEMPAGMAWPLATAAPLWGGWLAWREGRRRRCLFVFADGRPLTVDGVPAAEVRLAWRGPIAVLRWRVPGAGWACRSWWPDNLPAPRRRELRLAAGEHGASQHRRAMAP